MHYWWLANSGEQDKNFFSRPIFRDSRWYYPTSRLLLVRLPMKENIMRTLLVILLIFTATIAGAQSTEKDLPTQKWMADMAHSSIEFRTFASRQTLT